ncbi:glycine--tRNA ligase subunit beta [Candidatus Poribacteria bacterium]|nr:glycine--tRNA ligase subunit beta [Candidatus Poribacteria bacterium]
MPSDLVFEIGTEEIPARFALKAQEDFSSNAKKLFEWEALSFNKIQTFVTPRRLVLYVAQLAELQNVRTKSVQGPAKRVAYNENGELTKAGEGFARSQGISPESLKIKTTERGEYIFAEKEETGEKTIIVLKKILPELVLSFSFSRTMRWNGTLRFARPIRSCLALFGTEVVKFNLEGLTSGRTTHGHRLIKNKKIEIASAEVYFKQIKKAKIVIDPEKRKKIILSQIKKSVHELQGIPVITQELLNEVVNLVEFPVVIIGNFDADFLEIPKEVLIESMTSHQKYFPIQKEDGTLLNKFILVANNRNDKEIIREGNEKVLKARLSDAKFFYHEDTKTPLINKTENLKKVVFQEVLGTLFEKSKHIETLASTLASKLKLYEIDEQIKHCAILCKADLVTEMVKEFPKLQGIMGDIYARTSGESAEVADGIREHYLPRFAGDALPKTNIGTLVSIADKMDTITGCFVAGFIPTGSEDPYALRRQALGIIEILLDKKINLSIEEIAAQSIKLFENKIDSNPNINLKIIDFLIQRLAYILEEKGISHDSIDAALASSSIIPIEIKNKTEIIEKIKPHPNMIPLVLSFKRVANITAEHTNANEIDENLFKEDTEKNLFNLYKTIGTQVNQNLDDKDYNAVTTNLLQFANPLEEFFTKVLVMDAEPYKSNRITLLKNIRELFLKFADFSKLVVKKQ